VPPCFLPSPLFRSGARCAAMGRLSSNNECNERLKQIVNATVKKPDELYNMGEVIGEGRFSKVYEGVGTSGEHAGMKIALKEIDIGTLEEDEEALDMLEAEVLALRRAEGAANVVRLHAVIAASEAIFLAMERVPGRELFELVEERGALGGVLVRELMRQLLAALAALATLGVVHRDVKPENLMITDGSGATPARLTLIDFGYAALLSDAADSAEPGAGLLSGVAGSPEYAAPEVLSWLEVEAAEAEGDDSVQGDWYDAGCDVWSVGVTAHVLLSAELPFELPEDGDEAAIVAAARNLVLDFKRPEWQEAELQPAKDFVRSCMTTDRHARPTAQALLAHAWIGEGNSGKGVNGTFVEMLNETVAIENAAKAATNTL